MNKSLLICLAFIFHFVISTTITRAQEYEFRKVNKEELLKKESDIESDAGAEILYLNKEIYFDITPYTISLITEVHKRIKFYDTDAEDIKYATESIPLYVKDSDEKVTKLRAYSYNFEGGEVEETKLDRDQIFEKALSENYEEVTFTMPKVKKGTVIDIYYKISSPYYIYIDEIQFQFDIPAKKISAQINTPGDFNYNQINKGSVAPKLTTNAQIDQRMGMFANQYSYEIENVPSLKEEKYVDNIDNYRGGVLFELSSIKQSDGYVKYYSKTWEDVARTLASSDDYKNGLNRTNAFEEDIDQLIDQEIDTLERAKKIFKHVKETLRWNDKKSKYFKNGIRKTYKDKIGNSADINLSLVAMLRYAGIEASPVVISTRDNLKPFYPTLDRLNYVIALIRHNGKEYFLDATDKYSDFNILPMRDYNWNGLMVDNPNKLWKLIGLKAPDKSSSVYLINADLKENGTISGSVKVKKEDYSAYLFRKNYFSKSKEDLLRDKESDLKNILINDYEVKNINETGFVVEEYTYDFEPSIEKVNDQLFFKPFMFFATDDNPFKLEERNFPVDFIYPFENNYVINIKIPENYEITSLPAPFKLSLGENTGYYQYNITGNGKFIRLSINLEMHKSKVSPSQYEFLKQFYSNMINKEQEQIVLTKI